MEEINRKRQRSNEYDQVQQLLETLKQNCLSSKAKSELIAAEKAIKVAFYWEWKAHRVAL